MLYDLLRGVGLGVAMLVGAITASAAVENWTNVDGAVMEAEFQGRSGDNVLFRKADGFRYSYPYAKLQEADRARIDARMSGVTPKTVEPVEGKMPTGLTGKLVELNGKSLSASSGERLGGVKFLAFYYSAHWCPPCRGFTPELVKTYERIKASNPEFELIFISSDRTEEAMEGYMTEYGMKWPALKFGQKKTVGLVRRPSHERGIPNLVFMDAEGNELSTSYTPEGEYRGPRNVLKDIQRHFKM
ncbi:MAG: thioredoxin-like domain-containing protein [Verrucomicrobiota bacterium]